MTRRIAILDLLSIEYACDLLRTARREFRRSGATQAAQYVARAEKSAEGAIRHAQRMLTQQE